MMLLYTAATTVCDHDTVIVVTSGAIPRSMVRPIYAMVKAASYKYSMPMSL